MKSRLSWRAQNVLSRAASQANCHGCESLGPEHILFGILYERPCVALRVLGLVGLDIDRATTAVTHQVIAIDGPGKTTPHAGITSKSDAGRYSFTKHAANVMNRAYFESIALGDPYIGTEHLLLALLFEPDLPSVDSLSQQKIQYQSVRDLLQRRARGLA